MKSSCQLISVLLHLCACVSAVFCDARQDGRKVCASVGRSTFGLSLAQRHAKLELGPEMIKHRNAHTWVESEELGYKVMIPSKDKTSIGSPRPSYSNLLEGTPTGKKIRWEVSKLDLSPDDQGDWVFAMHHKAGTAVGELIALQLCTATGRKIYKYTYRETPADCTRCCHVLVKSYLEDFDTWMARVTSNSNGRFAHLVRNPVEMVISGYVYHWRGSESGWTNSTSCSRDMCSLPASEGEGLDKHEADALFQKMDLAQSLKHIGCSGYSTYLECVRSSTVKEGLNIETKRAHTTLSTMTEMTDRLRMFDQTISLCGDGFKPESFEGSVKNLVTFLGIPEEQVSHVVADAYEAVFHGRKSEKMIYGHSASMQSESSDDAILDASLVADEVRAWKSEPLPADLNDLQSRSACEMLD
eukprot:TRINITY_DN747_c0_g2_i1.p1 TRINITY_DN747_c0_g2~~TRINITY_DN747_c0_g2_i1.p1  ORF type:complete len:414 (+),score=32.40 TRINITY_DN747_c0_g2_i1:66-1307(+)